MAATAATVRATGTYRRMQSESRAAGADPVELVTMLYDELEIAIGVLAAMVRQRQPISATNLSASAGGIRPSATADRAAPTARQGLTAILSRRNLQPNGCTK